MANVEQAVDQIRAFVKHRVSLEAFEDWSASYIQNVHRIGSQEEQQLAHMVRSILNAFEDDETEDALRSELENAVRPFASPRVYAEPIEMVIGIPRFKAGSTAAQVQMEVAV